MPQKKHLDNIEKLAIQGLVLQGKETKEIAKAVGRPVAMIQKYLVELKDSLESIAKNKEPKVEKPKKAPPKRITAKDMMIKTGEGGTKGVAIMTKGASERGDAARSFREPRQDEAPTKPEQKLDVSSPRRTLKEFLHKIVDNK